MQLIGEADSPESKRRTLNTLNIVITQSGSQVSLIQLSIRPTLTRVCRSFR